MDRKHDRPDPTGPARRRPGEAEPPPATEAEDETPIEAFEEEGAGIAAKE